jgi:hypothetical protein
MLYELNEWVLFAGGFLLFYIAAEVGIRLGNGSRDQMDDHARSHIGTIEGSLLGFFALLLGFAFAMAMSRYDVRRHIVVDEANDIGTAYLRTSLLPQPYPAQLQKLLREYVETRIDYVQAGFDGEALIKASAETESLQGALWKKAVEAVEVSSDEVRTGYFIEALNDLIDDHTRRSAATMNHVPDFILVLLYFVGCITFVMAGYSSGVSGTRLFIPRLLLITSAAATLLVIIDLDRPRRGFITVSERALTELQQKLSQKEGQGGSQPESPTSPSP